MVKKSAVTQRNIVMNFVFSDAAGHVARGQEATSAGLSRVAAPPGPEASLPLQTSPRMMTAGLHPGLTRIEQRP